MVIEEQALRVTWRVTEISTSALLSLMRSAADNHNSIQHGEQKITALNRQDRALENVSLEKTDIKVLRQQLRRYGVDFSIVRDPRTDPDIYKVFFKGQDVERVWLGIERCVKDFSQEPGSDRKRPVKEVLEDISRQSETRAAQRREQAHTHNQPERGPEAR